MEIPILGDDPDLLAVNKPAGLSTIPPRGPLALEGSLVRRLEEQSGQKLFIVHRLDRETSGLIVFAKTAEAHRHLCRQFESREVEKTYLALVEGRVEHSGVVDRPLREFGSGRMGVARGGKPSRTRYEVEARFADSTLLRVFPETGRRHQVRVHLYAIGHPVMGDPVYGDPRPVGGAARLMLHALSLDCAHPAGGRLELKAPVGPDWEAVMRARTNPD